MDVIAPFYSDTGGNLQASIEGELKTWYPDGTLESDDFYENGKPKGKYSLYYDNGQLMLEIDYDNETVRYLDYDGNAVGSAVGHF